MTHFASALVANPEWKSAPFCSPPAVHHSVLVVRDQDQHNELLETICEFLDIGVEYATSRDDLRPMLIGMHPMVVIADLESESQDGFHVMKMVGECDRSLPILLLSNNDVSLLGAVDAIQELWGLRRVTVITGVSGIGEMVDFICQAARDAGMPRLMRI